MSNIQFYLTIGIPTLAILLGMFMNTVQFNAVNARLSWTRDSAALTADSTPWSRGSTALMLGLTTWK
jgi:hypothetical protein